MKISWNPKNLVRRHRERRIYVRGLKIQTEEHKQQYTLENGDYWNMDGYTKGTRQ